MRFLTLMLIVALVLLAPAAQAQAPGGAVTVKATDAAASVTLYERSYALVIGIDAYANGWPKLSEAREDAKVVARELTAHGFEVTPVFDTNADALRKAFEDFIYGKGQDPEARVFIWFAGHGHTLDGEGYLVPTDAPHPDKGAEFRRRSLSLRRFGEYMREIKAKHVLAVFDSCFAGTVFTTARALPPPPLSLRHCVALDCVS
ncbi:MAG: caspase family protein [Hyphomicrobiaceae bacterium]|nr:caspase family protein [Hyphomicrobiaceae bacterium]